MPFLGGISRWSQIVSAGRGNSLGFNLSLYLRFILRPVLLFVSGRESHFVGGLRLFKRREVSNHMDC